MMILRKSYAAIRAKYRKLGKGNVRLTQSDLVLILPIQPTKDKYDFIVLENDNTVPASPFESRLNMNDEFVATDFAVYLLGRAHPTSETPTSPFSTRWYTFAPSEVDSDMIGLEDFWNGKMDITVNKISFLEKWHLRKHNCTPFAQHQNTSAGIPYATLPSLDFQQNGNYPMQPMITFSGAKKNSVQIALPAAISAASFVFVGVDGVSTTVDIDRVAVVFRGMLAQNAATFQSAAKKK